MHFVSISLKFNRSIRMVTALNCNNRILRSINTGYDYKLPSLFTLILSKVSARQILNAKNHN